MILFAILAGAAVLVASAFIWGTDSRDGHDWAPDPYPAERPPIAQEQSPLSPWAHHEG
jgi:hypothetical protein